MTEETLNDAGEITSDSSDKMLDTRATRYGLFKNQAALSQTLKNTIMQHYFTTKENPKPMEPYMAESISMICHKLARIANGDPMYDDSWRDIEGYAKLVADELNGVSR